MKELALSVAGAAEKPSGTTVQTTSGDAFVPKALTIRMGTTVVRQNESPGIHPVTDNADLASEVGLRSCLCAAQANSGTPG